MKQIHRYALAVAGVLLISGAALAQTTNNVDIQLNPQTISAIEQNLVAGLKDTDHPGLQESSTTVLLNLQLLDKGFDFSDALFPLMSIVKDEHEPAPARILAAVALRNLNSARGDYAIEMTAQMSDEPRVQKVCAALYASTRP